MEHYRSHNIDCGSAYDLTLVSNTAFVGFFFPTAKIGHGNYVYVYELNGINWFGLSAITAVNHFGGVPTSLTNIPVIQAYNIDKKIDDGLPVSGKVQTTYLNAGVAPATVLQNAPSGPLDNLSTCYNTTSNMYSVGTTNGGGSANCALSFVMQ